MIHTATKSVKFRRLTRKLSQSIGCSKEVAKVRAVGHLELLWHFTMESARRGDIGQFENIEIADEIGWDGDPDEIIEILASTGWIDRDEQHRLLVHDWHEHAPTFIKRTIHRSGGFLTESITRPSNGSGVQGLGLVTAQVTQKTSEMGVNETTPNLTKLNLTKPEEGEEPPDGDPPLPDEQTFDELIDAWNELPGSVRKVGNRRGKAITKAWRKVQAKPDHRRHFRDVSQLMASIRGSPWLFTQGFFEFVWLFGQKSGRWNVEKIQAGNYRDSEGSGRTNPAQY